MKLLDSESKWKRASPFKQKANLGIWEVALLGISITGQSKLDRSYQSGMWIG